MIVSRRWLRMKKFLPSVALKIALNVQLGASGKAHRKKERTVCSGKRERERERGGKEKGGARFHEVEEKNEKRVSCTRDRGKGRGRGREGGGHTTFHFREGL